MARWHLLTNWRRVIRRAWSIRLVVLAGLLSGCEVVLPLFVDAIPRNVFAVLAILAAIGGVFARVIAQPQIDRRVNPRASPDAARERYE